MQVATQAGENQIYKANPDAISRLISQAEELYCVHVSALEVPQLKDPVDDCTTRDGVLYIETLCGNLLIHIRRSWFHLLHVPA